MKEIEATQNIWEIQNTCHIIIVFVLLPPRASFEIRCKKTCSPHKNRCLFDGGVKMFCVPPACGCDCIEMSQSEKEE